MKIELKLSTDEEALETLRHLDELKAQSMRLQKIVVEHLVAHHGGLRAAARALGTAPGNLVNLRSGCRRASLELLSRYLKTTESQK